MTNIKETYSSASKEFLGFHASIDDAHKIFKDNDRFLCDNCLDIYKQSLYHDGRVIISNVPEEGLHLVGLSN